MAQNRTDTAVLQVIINQKIIIYCHSQNPSLLNTWAVATSAITLALSVVIYPQGVVAGEKFTAADVLNWTETQQDSFFETSVSMAGVIAVQSQNPAGSCINDWFFKSDASKRKANQEIRETMIRFSDFYPASVIVALIEKKCGDITPTN